MKALVSLLLASFVSAQADAYMMYPPSVCTGLSKPAPFSIVAPGQTAGPMPTVPFHLIFWTSAVPDDPQPSTPEPVWIIAHVVASGPGPDPLFGPLDGFGMPGCWLGTTMELIYPVPAVTGWNGMFLREPSANQRIEVAFTAPAGSTGMAVQVQLLVGNAANPAGLALSPAIFMRVGP